MAMNKISTQLRKSRSESFCVAQQFLAVGVRLSVTETFFFPLPLTSLGAWRSAGFSSQHRDFVLTKSSQSCCTNSIVTTAASGLRHLYLVLTTIVNAGRAEGDQRTSKYPSSSPFSPFDVRQQLHYCSILFFSAASCQGRHFPFRFSSFRVNHQLPLPLISVYLFDRHCAVFRVYPWWIVLCSGVQRYCNVQSPGPFRTARQVGSEVYSTLANSFSQRAVAAAATLEDRTTSMRGRCRVRAYPTQREMCRKKLRGACAFFELRHSLRAPRHSPFQVASHCSDLSEREREKSSSTLLSEMSARLAQSCDFENTNGYPRKGRIPGGGL